jgi:molecular chaperone DnaK
MPRIRVSFDIDANGILSVTARDEETGKEQSVTISESTNLSRQEVEKMVSDSEAHAAEDKSRRETVEERNSADTLAYQLERSLKDLGEKVPVNEKARCEVLIEETRKAVADETASLERLRQLASDLRQALEMIASAALGQAQQGGSGRGPRQQSAGFGQEEYRPRPGGGEDVIDAEFTEH